MSFNPVVDARVNDVVWPPLAWPPAKTLTGKFVELSVCVPDRDADPLFSALDHDEVWRHLPARPRSAEDYASALRKRLAEGRLVWTVRLLQPLAGLPAGSDGTVRDSVLFSIIAEDWSMVKAGLLARVHERA
jgi:hypothetical protein